MSQAITAEPMSALQPQQKASRRDWIAIYAMMLGAFMAILDIQIINSSLANIQGSLSATISEGSWISTSYMIAEIVMIPLSGWLVTVFSLRRYLLWSVAGFIIFSGLCGLAWDLNSMIVFRALQGIAVAPLIPLSFTLVRSRLSEAEQPKGMALFSFTIVFAPAIGPSIGGWLTENYSWHLIFYLNVIPGLLMMYLLSYSLDRESMQLDKLKNADWLGILTLSLGLASLEFVLEEGNRNNWFQSHEITTMAIVTGLMLPVFVYLQLTHQNPLLNLRILKDRQFTLGVLANSAVGLAMFGSVFLLPVYLGQVQGYNALQIGEVMLWAGLPQLLVIPLLPLLMKHIDKRWLCLFGMALFTLSAWMNSNMSIDYAGDQFKLSLLVRAIGQPFIMVPLSVITMAKIGMKDIPSASSLYNTSRNLSGAIGIAIVSTMIDKRSSFHEVRIGESLAQFSHGVQQYFETLHNAMPQLSLEQQGALLMQQVSRDASIMAFNDSFLFMAAILGLGFFAILGMKADKVPS